MEKIELGNSRSSRRVKKKKLERLYDKKPFIELIVALLSIPSLLLLVILNYNSVKNLNSSKITPTPAANNPINSGTNETGVNPNFFTAPIIRPGRPTDSSSTQEPCSKHLGPINITSPNEGSTLTNNPVEVDISYDDSTYCSAVWSYSVNGSNWSDYSNNSVALYNLPNGPITFQLRVKSLTSSDTTTLTRDFTYNGPSSAVVPTNASSSAH